MDKYNVEMLVSCNVLVVVEANSETEARDKAEELFMKYPSEYTIVDELEPQEITYAGKVRV